MTFEERVESTLRAADTFDPSHDLFAKVRRSIEEDHAHRRRLRRVVAWIGATVAAVLAYLAVTVEIVDGMVEVSFLALETLTTAIMVGLVVVLGPAIRRFGETYEQAMFGSSPDTGRRVLDLLDVSYYLIFGAFILMTTMFHPQTPLGLSLGEMLQLAFERIGGLLLLMGILHIVLVLALPVSGLVFGANQRRARIALGGTPTDPMSARIERWIGIAAWIVAALVAFQIATSVLGLLAGLAGA